MPESALDMPIDMIAADHGIRQLHARFVEATWRMDSTAFAECFAEDGQWKIAGLDLRGREAIGATIGRMLSSAYRKVMLNVGTPVLDVVDGAVVGRVPVTEFAQMLDGSSAMSIGIYHDWYVEERGRWRFAKRHWNFQYRGPMDLTGMFLDRPDYGPPPGMPGPDEPTYVRPK